MDLVSILFVEQEAMSPKESMGASNAPGVRPLTGDEQVTAALASLFESQIRQTVAVIPANYWKLNS